MIDLDAKKPTFKIKSVSEKGSFTLEFDQNMVKMVDLTLFNTTVLDVTLKMKEEETIFLKPEWNVT